MPCNAQTGHTGRNLPVSHATSDRMSASTYDGISRSGMSFLQYFITLTPHVITRNYFDIVLLKKGLNNLQEYLTFLFASTIYNSSWHLIPI